MAGSLAAGFATGAMRLRDLNSCKSCCRAMRSRASMLAKAARVGLSSTANALLR
jgi:hypothetical protein